MSSIYGRRRPGGGRRAEAIDGVDDAAATVGAKEKSRRVLRTVVAVNKAVVALRYCGGPDGLAMVATLYQQ